MNISLTYMMRCFCLQEKGGYCIYLYMKNKTIIIRVTDEEHKIIKMAAAQREESITKLVKKAIVYWMNKYCK